MTHFFGIALSIGRVCVVVAALAAATAPARAERNTVHFDFQTSQARTIDLHPSTYVMPLVAEVVIDQAKGRIHDTWEMSLRDFQARTIDGNDEATLQNLRAYGLFKSSEKHECDVIVAATFDIRISDNGVVINLIGYPANFANWHTGTTADYDWILLQRGIQNIPLNSTPPDLTR